MSNFQKIDNAIEEYANAYKKLQELQKEKSYPIPPGDQKTGCIGEYYIYRYLESLYPNKIEYGHTTQKGWDIKINTEKPIYIQVKTVSAYSKTRTISPIHKGWNELYLLYLDKKLYPKGFWVIEDSDIFNGKEKLTSKKCPKPNNSNTGSDLPFGENKIKSLLNKISLN